MLSTRSVPAPSNGHPDEPGPDEHRTSHSLLGQRPWLAPVGLGAAVMAGTAYVGLLNPNTSHAFPICPLRYYTGIDCPACGGLRATFSLTRGHLLQAADHNLLFVAALPFLVLGYGLWLARSLGLPVPRLKAPAHSVAILLAVVAVFTVARNLPVPGLTWLRST